jgi:hypothetical protein
MALISNIKQHWRKWFQIKTLSFFKLAGWGFGYCGHYWPIVPAPDGRWWWLWRNWWNEDWQGKPKYAENTCPSATLSTTNPTWLDPGLNLGRHSGKPATNHLSYGTTNNTGLVNYLLNKIQNEFTSLLGNKVWAEIISHINRAKYFLLLFNYTPEAAHQVQMAQIIQYISVTNASLQKGSFTDFIHVYETTCWHHSSFINYN